MTQPRKFWMRWRVCVGYPVAAIYLILANPIPRSILWGALLAGFGLIIRGASSGHLRKDRELATAGPYAFTRNPLYLGSSLLAAGFAVAGHSWVAGLLVMAYFAIFYYFVMRNEEADLRIRFGAPFDEYAARVPLFFPRFSPWEKSEAAAAAGAQPFSWAQYRKNREYQALIGVLAGLAVLWVRLLLRARFGH